VCKKKKKTIKKKQKQKIIIIKDKQKDISKVRSLSLDQWEPDLLDMMCGLGNDLVNSIYEANIPDDRVKPVATDTRYFLFYFFICSFVLLNGVLFALQNSI
jgi:Putative GTPase activating protein for Arf